MSVNFSAIIDEVNKFTKELKEPKQIVPPVPLPTKSVDEEVKDELEKPHYKHQTEDAKFITKCYKYLRKLGLVESPLLWLLSWNIKPQQHLFDICSLQLL